MYTGTTIDVHRYYHRCTQVLPQMYISITIDVQGIRVQYPIFLSDLNEKAMLHFTSFLFKFKSNLLVRTVCLLSNVCARHDSSGLISCVHLASFYCHVLITIYVYLDRPVVFTNFSTVNCLSGCTAGFNELFSG